MASMFIAQRSAFMVDFQTRAEFGLKRPEVPFAIKRYALAKIQTVIGVRKDIPGAFEEVSKMYRAFRSFKYRPETKVLEKKYQFIINWGPDEYK